LSRRSSGQPGVTPASVAIGLIILKLPLKIALVPEQSLIEILALHRPDQSLHESIGTRKKGNGIDLIDFEYPKIRPPAMKAK
jgi:hypothetical protein